MLRSKNKTILVFLRHELRVSRHHSVEVYIIKQDWVRFMGYIQNKHDGKLVKKIKISNLILKLKF